MWINIARVCGGRMIEVSVIVPNHNRDISNLRASIPESDEIEVIEINKGLERSVQRNMGIQAADGKYLLILDSDQSISPGLIKECVAWMEAGYTSLYIPEIIVADSFFGKIRNFERQFMTGTAVDVPRFVRKDQCPEFDPTMSGPEDADWGQRIKGKRRITTNILYHNDAIKFWDYCKKKAYYTKSMKWYIKKWPNDPCINLKYRCFTIFVEKGKWKELLRHPVLTAGVIFLLITRGIIYATQR